MSQNASLQENSAATISMIGTVIDGRFHVDELVKDGPMGTVFLATQTSIDRQIILKILHKNQLSDDVNLQRFMQEAKIISTLTHPNIVRLLDFGQTEDMLFLAMEYIQGVTLGEVLKDHRFTYDFALEIIYQICGALSEPHQNEVIHRDLKPDNIMLVPMADGSMQVKVVDFGLARAMGTGKRATAAGIICGTPAYMAPEQAQEGDIEARTDLYALGVLLYEMLCGFVPFDAETTIKVILQQIQKEPTPLTTFLSPDELPDDVDALVKQLLSKSPNGRPASALTARRQLEDLMDDLRTKRIRVETSGDLVSRFSKWLRPCSQDAYHALVHDSEVADISTATSAPVTQGEPETQQDATPVEINAPEPASTPPALPTEQTGKPTLILSQPPTATEEALTPERTIPAIPSALKDVQPPPKPSINVEPPSTSKDIATTEDTTTEEQELPHRPTLHMFAPLSQAEDASSGVDAQTVEAPTPDATTADDTNSADQAQDEKTPAVVEQATQPMMSTFDSLMDDASEEEDAIEEDIEEQLVKHKTLIGLQIPSLENFTSPSEVSEIIEDTPSTEPSTPAPSPTSKPLTNKKDAPALVAPPAKPDPIKHDVAREDPAKEPVEASAPSTPAANAPGVRTSETTESPVVAPVVSASASIVIDPELTMPAAQAPQQDDGPAISEDDAFFDGPIEPAFDVEHIWVDEDYKEPKNKGLLIIPVLVILVLLVGGGIYALVASDIGKKKDAAAKTKIAAKTTTSPKTTDTSPATAPAATKDLAAKKSDDTSPLDEDTKAGAKQEEPPPAEKANVEVKEAPKDTPKTEAKTSTTKKRARKSRRKRAKVLSPQKFEPAAAVKSSTAKVETTPAATKPKKKKTKKKKKSKKLQRNLDWLRKR